MTSAIGISVAILFGAPVIQAGPSTGTPPPVSATPTGDGKEAKSPAGATPVAADTALRPDPTGQVQPSKPETPAAQSETTQSDIVVVARDPAAAPDPFRAVNLQAFKATQAVDGAVVGPVSMAYAHAVPRPIRSGVHNFLYNLREPVVFVNFVLQHKIGKAAETFGRFALNSTIGVAGVIDVAKKHPFRLPRRGNGFADTLGFYGVPPGPFFFLPIVGPTTVRDLAGGFADRLVLPFIVGKKLLRHPAYAIPAGVLGVLDHRAEFDETLHTLHDNVPDPYANTRSFYLRRRQAEIDHLRGRETGNSSPMSEAPTDPIRVRQHLRPVEPSPPTAPTAPAPGN